MSTPNPTTPAVRRRRPTGQLVRRKTKTGTSYGVRFQLGGQRHFRTLGSTADGWTTKAARKEIDRLMALAFSGAWDPAADGRREPEPGPEQTFEEFVMGRDESRDPGWLERRRATGGRSGDGLSERGEADLVWAVRHLLGWFGGFALDEITTQEVETFIHAKRTSGLSATSVRRFLRLLRAILQAAIRYDLIARDPTQGISIKVKPYKGTFLGTAEELTALLAAAGELDEERRVRRGHGRALLAVLSLAGLRINEALSLAWRDVRLAEGTLRVRRSKTEAGERDVDLLPLLRDELDALKARRDPDPDSLVFGTRTGGKESPSNVRNRVLRPAAERASAALVERGRDALPKLTPHSLRRTFATFLVAAGGPDDRAVDPLYLADQLGHEDPTLSLRVYASAVGRRDGEPERIRALVRGEALDAPEAEAPAEAEVEGAA